MSRRAEEPPPPRHVFESLAEANRRDALEWQGLAMWTPDLELKTRATIMQQAHQKAALAWDRVAQQ